MSKAQQQQLFVCCMALSGLVNTFANTCKNPNDYISADQISLLQTKVTASGSIGKKDSNQLENAMNKTKVKTGAFIISRCCATPDLTQFSIITDFSLLLGCPGSTEKVSDECCTKTSCLDSCQAATDPNAILFRTDGSRNKKCASKKETKSRNSITAAIDGNNCEDFFKIYNGAPQKFIFKWAAMDPVFAQRTRLMNNKCRAAIEKKMKAVKARKQLVNQYIIMYTAELRESMATTAGQARDYQIAKDALVTAKNGTVEAAKDLLGNAEAVNEWISDEDAADAGEDAGQKLLAESNEFFRGLPDPVKIAAIDGYCADTVDAEECQVTMKELGFIKLPTR